MSKETIEKKKTRKRRITLSFGYIILMGVMFYCIFLLSSYIFLLGGAY